MRLIIGLALQEKINENCKLKLKFIIYILNNYFKIKILIIAPDKLLLSIYDINCEIVTYADDETLFDFSRYYRIISCTQINNDDILLSFNDTLGKGRNFRSGLLFYIGIVIFMLVYDKKKIYDIFSPLDSDRKETWICPYFFIGRVGFLRSLNFIDWVEAYKSISKPVRRNLIVWLNKGWRHSRTASKEQKNIKFKTLILERALLKNYRRKKLVFMYSRSNIFRIINSLLIY